MLFPLIIAALFAVTPASVLAEALSASLADLTENLVSLADLYRTADGAEQSKLLNDLTAIATERRNKLSSDMEKTPAEVLRFAISSAQRVRIPSPIQQYIEEWVEIEGTVEVLAEDPGRYIYSLQSGSRRYKLRFADKPPDLISGSRIRVKGVRLGNDIAL